MAKKANPIADTMSDATNDRWHGPHREVRLDQYHAWVDSYWGTPDQWAIIDADAPSHEEFDSVRQYLNETGEAST